ncbi:MAG TPA: peptide deformylase [Bosea sp. (in: a-proteobacteria)]|jgi:peptide deformylase|uniref:peptide deformylase n=1 Tax=Bosea sp. (in: a-proteobacteria) TaxID=1871050 RepID=UPI002DDD6669|nr:peptide deformylase [Bosea sp. (in: a-proteobacteria)]HEV2553587.1 peptide deformylase [Bosea sp. (in: a-proteobacteria)]
MAIRPLVILPDTQLRLVSTPVAEITPEIRTLVADMFETMYDAPGIGLAAIQIGVPKRVVTLDVAKRAASEQADPEDTDAEVDQEKRDAQPRNPIAFINPEITWSSEERSVYEEGCLSIPEYYEEVERPASVKVAYTDLDGKRQEIEADGLLATCIQHEIDHLNGVLFIDHLSRLKRERVTKRFAKQARREG